MLVKWRTRVTLMVIGGRKAVRYGPGPMIGERAPSRHVALDGAVNVRDIGGYRIVGGPEGFRGRLFRGDPPGRLPLLYHCTGGKDRAGWMTAIVLTAIGVPRELVLRDYLLSNDFHRTGYQKLRFDLVKTGIVADPELLRPVLELSPTYLGAAFEEADRQYGSFGRFLAYGLEVSEAMLTELRRALLGDLVPREPVPLTPGRRHLLRCGPRRRRKIQVSSTKSSPSPIVTPMSVSHCDGVCSHST